MKEALTSCHPLTPSGPGCGQCAKDEVPHLEVWLVSADTDQSAVTTGEDRFNVHRENLGRAAGVFLTAVRANEVVGPSNSSVHSSYASAAASHVSRYAATPSSWWRAVVTVATSRTACLLFATAIDVPTAAKAGMSL